jgi:hypothetical protein
MSKERCLKAARIEVAINICLRFPTLYPRMLRNETVLRDDAEHIAENVLLGLLKLEPCVKHILDFYYRREQR